MNTHRNEPDRRLSVAPMMARTDRHERYLLRLITRRTLLYTEMVSAGALVNGDPARLLAFHRAEHPLALQVGGSRPPEMAQCARLAEAAGFDEVNINVGCPSARVRDGRFGACLMAEPQLVGRCVRAMRDACALPVTVKTRIGIDDRDSYAVLLEFVRIVADSGCRTFIIHARKAWLRGLSPAQNRTLPPLRYERVYRLKQDLPELEIVLNGGVHDLESVRAKLACVDGVMIGREAYRNPYLLAGADRAVFGEDAEAPTREEVVLRFLPYLRAELARGTPLTALTRHLLGLYQSRPGARRWRRFLTEGACRPGAGPRLLLEALELVKPPAPETAVPGAGARWPGSRPIEDRRPEAGTRRPLRAGEPQCFTDFRELRASSCRGSGSHGP